MNDRLRDEVVELTQKISALGGGYSNAAVLYAAVSLIAQCNRTDGSGGGAFYRRDIFRAV
jgi:hypothetical protein